MKRYAHPLADGRIARISLGETLEVDDGLTTIMWSIEDFGVKASSSCAADDVTRSLSSSIADLTDIPITASEPFMRAWLADQLKTRHDMAIEMMLERALPALQNLYRHHSGVSRLARISERLFSALREGATPREIAAAYWADDATRSDGTAFINALRIGNDLDESRVALMQLVPAGDHRRRLVEVASPTIWFVPASEISDITTDLDVPAAVDFAEVAIRDPRSRLQLTAARALLMRASGTNGATAYRQLLDQILRSQFAAPRTLAERAIARGPVEGLPLTQIVTDSELRALAKRAKNCLANPSYPWHGRVLRGEVSLLTVGKDHELKAIVAVDPKTGAVLEARGKGNASAPVALVAALEAHLAGAETEA